MRNRVICCALAALALCAAAGGGAVRAAGDPRELLAKHADFVGKPQGIVLTYRVETRRAPASDDFTTEETKYRRSALFHTVWHGEGVTVEGGFDRRAYWSSNENGYTVNQFGEAARRDLTRNAVDAGFFGEDAELTDRGAQTIDGKSVHVVRVTPHGGVAADLALDAGTGAYVAVTFEPDDRYHRETLHVMEYREIAPGVRVPAAYRHGEGTRYALAQGTVRAVTDEELSRPVPVPHWSFGTSTLPLEFEGTRKELKSVYVHGSVNGHTGKFLLDTGASQVVLYHPYADKLGLAMLGATEYGGVAGRTVAARYARAQAIAFADHTLSNVVVAVAPDDGAKAGMRARGIDGILGFDVLAGAVVHVDLNKETIAFGDPAKAEPVLGAHEYVFPVNLADNTPEIGVMVGKVPTRATIDTGNSSFIALSDNLRTSGRLVALGGPSSYSVGVDGIADEPDPCFQIHDVGIGPILYQNSFVCLGKERVFGRDGGLIGLDFLHHFNWTFDYTHARVVLSRNGL